MQPPLRTSRVLTGLARTAAGLADLARTAVGTAVESAAAVATVPVRLVRLIGAVELLVNQIMVATDRADALLQRTGTVVDEAAEAVRETRVIAAAAALAVQEASTVASGAAATVATAQRVAERAAVTAAEADGLLAEFGPTLRKAAPMAQHFVDQLTPEELTAAIRLIDDLPRLRDHLTADVLPLLGTLERVGPDVHALLEVTRDLKLAVAGIPGLRMLRRRGEDRLADDEVG
jgi:hypothetical protein